MAIKTERVEARVSPDERARIERAASTEGMSTSAFIVSAAVARAEAIIARSTTTTVPADYFDALLAALDAADSAPQLTKAAQRSAPGGRIRVQ